MFKDIRATIEIDLKKNKEELWNNLDKDARWGVNKARKSGLRVQISDEGRAWEEFYHIYKETIIRGGIVPKEKEELKSETNKLFLCFCEDKIIAGAAIKIHKDKIELFLNASKKEFLNFQPNNLLYWEIIEWGKQNNYSVFDLGGYQLNTERGDKLYEVNRFKERWGGEIRKYEVSSKNPFYILGRKVIRKFHFVKKIRDKIKLVKYKTNEKYISRVKEEGFFKGVIKGFRKFFRKFIFQRTKIIIFGSDLSKDVIRISPKIEVELKKCGEKEFNNMVFEKYLTSQLIKNRIKKGDECFIYLKDSKIIHYSWLAFKEIDISEVGKNFNLNNDEACIFDCWTLKNFRGNKLYSSMLTEIKNYLKERGYKRVYIYADQNNKDSVKGIERAVFYKEKTIKYFNFLGKKNKKVYD